MPGGGVDSADVSSAIFFAVRGKGLVMKKTLAVVTVVASCLLAGCFDVEQSLVLERNLSGKAGFNMKVNFEPMVLFMLRFQREMQGLEGDPTPAELAKAKQDFLASRKSETSPAKIEADKAELKKGLPAGVQLLESDFKEDGLTVAARFLFGFDNVDKLGLIALPGNKKGQEQQQPGPENPFDEPFANLKLVDEGKTLLLTSVPVNPMAEQQEQTEGMEMTPEVQQQMKDAFKGLRVAFKIKAPFEVVETNATRREGDTLYWEYDLATFEKMAKEKEKKEPEGIRVRFRK